VDSKRTISLPRSEARVGLTGVQHPSLFPITFVLASGTAHLQEYIRPEQARSLAAALTAAAAEAERAESMSMEGVLDGARLGQEAPGE
jgi:hypothetical protein